MQETQEIKETMLDRLFRPYQVVVWQSAPNSASFLPSRTIVVFQSPHLLY